MTSSMSSPLMPVRATSARSTVSPSSVAGTSLKTPPYRPMGVRNGSQITACFMMLPSIRLGQAEHFLRNEVQHHLLRHRCNLQQSRFAPQSLDVILPRVRVAAMHLHRAITHFERRLGGQVLCRVRLRTAWLVLVEQLRRL